jgi:hypothetical protein
MERRTAGHAPIPTPEEWFGSFAAAYTRELRTRNSDLNQTLQRERVRRKLGTAETYYSSGESPEWTSIMSVFLARLAKRLGFRQEWEWVVGKKRRRRIDLVWYPPERTGPIGVLIEHESQWANRLATRRLWSRSRNVAPDVLRVLITYLDTIYRPRSPRTWSVVRSEIIKGLGSRKLPRGGFLVCVGPDDGDPSDYWEAFRWLGNREFCQLPQGLG